MCVESERERERGSVYIEWECVQKNRENVYCVVITNVCI